MKEYPVKVKYVGPHDAVEVDGVGVVKRGEPVEVGAAHGKGLLEQVDNWQPVTAKKEG